jgi:hypothetical protein
MFFGFGILARANVTTVAVMAVGAFSVASATFLIVELSTLYSGFLRHLLASLIALEALGK